MTHEVITRRLKKFGIKSPITRSVFELLCDDCNTTYLSKGRKKGNDGKFRCKKCQHKISNNRPASQACQKAYNLTPRKKIIQRRWSLKNYYGLSEEQYLEILAAQNGVCKICRGKEPKGHLVVDHNHLDGAVRGLLCHNCNRALGLFKDDPALLVVASEYLTGELQVRK